MPATNRQMDNLKPTFDALYVAVQNFDLPAFLAAVGALVAFITGWKSAAKPGDTSGMGPSYPPTHDAATALDYIRHGYGFRGITGGRWLNDDQINERNKGLSDALAYYTAHGVPADMAEYGYRYGLTPFAGARTFGSPDADLAEFVGKSLQTWLDQEWQIIQGGGTPSVGGTGR